MKNPWKFLAIFAIVSGILIIFSTDELTRLIPQSDQWYTYWASLPLIIGAVMMAAGIFYFCWRKDPL